VFGQKGSRRLCGVLDYFCDALVQAGWRSIAPDVERGGKKS
jgi:hypothetical protein